MGLETLYEELEKLFWDHFPLPILVACVLLMLAPALLFRPKGATPFLEPEKWKSLKLTKKTVVNHNVRVFRFDLPAKYQPLGLPLGQHISLRSFDSSGEEVIKPYTPTTDLGVRGFVEFVIKVYPEGRMSQAMDSLKVGDKLDFKGPKGRFRLELNEKRALGMIAGGTGITPMYQVAKALLQDQEEYTTISLIYANVTEEDILLKEELDKLTQEYSRFQVYYVLNKPPANWKGGEGFVTKEMISRLLPKPANDILVTRCGPPPMNKAMRAYLLDLGYTQDMLFEF